MDMLPATLTSCFTRCTLFALFGYQGVKHGLFVKRPLDVNEQVYFFSYVNGTLFVKVYRDGRACVFRGTIYLGGLCTLTIAIDAMFIGRGILVAYSCHVGT